MVEGAASHSLTSDWQEARAPGCGTGVRGRQSIIGRGRRRGAVVESQDTVVGASVALSLSLLFYRE